MKIIHVEKNGKIVPVRAEIESEEEIEFLLNQLRPTSKWTFNTRLMQFVCKRCGQIPTKGTGCALDSIALQEYHFCRFCGADMRKKKELGKENTNVVD